MPRLFRGTLNVRVVGAISGRELRRSDLEILARARNLDRSSGTDLLNAKCIGSPASDGALDFVTLSQLTI